MASSRIIVCLPMMAITLLVAGCSRPDSAVSEQRWAAESVIAVLSQDEYGGFDFEFQLDRDGTPMRVGRERTRKMNGSSYVLLIGDPLKRARWVFHYYDYDEGYTPPWFSRVGAAMIRALEDRGDEDTEAALMSIWPDQYASGVNVPESNDLHILESDDLEIWLYWEWEGNTRYWIVEAQRK